MIGRNWPFWPFLAAAIFFGAHARAHSWYDMICCGGMDCAPVDHVEMVAGSYTDTNGDKHVNPMPSMVVTTRHGTVIVPQNFPRLPSKDGNMHACIVAGQLRCLYEPPRM